MQTTIQFISNNIKFGGKLEQPVSECFGHVLFAHCFTGGKDGRGQPFADTQLSYFF